MRVAGLLVMALMIGGVIMMSMWSPALPSADAASADNSPAVIVELFTSEGCSSCPPADEFLADLMRNPPVDGIRIVPLAFHVDYWNHLGWTDPFSNKTWSDRQHAYAAAFRGEQVYTPQMVVDGREGFVGIDRAKAGAVLASSAHSPKARVELARKTGAKVGDAAVFNVSVSDVPAGLDAGPIDVLLVVTEDGLHTQVPRGENAGRQLAHAAVVRELRVVGQAAPAKVFNGEATVILREGWSRPNVNVVAFIQHRVTRRILGASARTPVLPR
jgi:hypothetical protein